MIKNPSAISGGVVCSLIQSVKPFKSNYLLLFLRTIPVVATAAAARTAGITATAAPVGGLTGSPEHSPGLTSPEDSPGSAGSSVSPGLVGSSGSPGSTAASSSLIVNVFSTH